MYKLQWFAFFAMQENRMLAGCLYSAMHSGGQRLLMLLFSALQVGSGEEGAGIFSPRQKLLSQAFHTGSLLSTKWIPLICKLQLNAGDGVWVLWLQRLVPGRNPKAWVCLNQMHMGLMDPGKFLNHRGPTHRGKLPLRDENHLFIRRALKRWPQQPPT